MLFLSFRSHIRQFCLSRVTLASDCRSSSALPHSANGLNTASAFAAAATRFDDFLHEFNDERPHEGLQMKRPAEVYAPSPRPYDGLPDLSIRPHDRDALVTACGRICMYRKRVYISGALAGQRLGVKEVDEGIWLVSFMSYDLGVIDLEQKTLQPLDNPLGPRLSPMSQVRCVTYVSGLDTKSLVRLREANRRCK